jgi:hypothetical protein
VNVTPGLPLALTPGHPLGLTLGLPLDLTPGLPFGSHPCNSFCLGREPKARVATVFDFFQPIFNVEFNLILIFLNL